MTIDDIGATAFLIAGVRAFENSRDEPLFCDPYAELFLDETWRMRTQKLVDVHYAVADAIRLRTTALNTILEEEIARGVRQVVTLGCGFDMRHAIYADEEIRFFDVDQPPVLEFKSGALKKAGVPMCARVDCNYLDIDLPDQLVQAGLDADAPILFIWEGNTMYLPGDRIFGFLSTLCERMATFRIGFDYLLKSVIDGTYGDAEAITLVRDIQRAIGVSFQTGFDSLDRFESDLAFTVIEAGNILDIGIRRAGPENIERLSSVADVSEALADVYRLALIERG